MSTFNTGAHAIFKCGIKNYMYSALH